MLSAELALTEHDHSTFKGYEQDVWHRQLMFLNTLTAQGYALPDGEVANRQIELRLISRPTESLQPVMDIVILFKMSHHIRKISHSAACQQVRDVKESLQALLSESFWSIVGSMPELETLLLPFPVHYGAEIGRKLGRIDVSGKITSAAFRDTPMGFTGSIQPNTSTKNKGASRKDDVIMVFPYSPVLQGWNFLCKRFLHYPHAIMARIVIRPTQLKHDERDYLTDEIAWLNALVNGHDDNASDRNLYRRQLEMLLNISSEKKLALEDRVMEVYTQIFSDAPLTQGIVDSFGSTITLQAPSEKFGSYGYDWNFMSKGTPFAALLNSMELTDGLNVQDEGMPSPRIRYLMDSNETLGVFHLPYVSPDGMPGIPVNPFRTVAAKISGTEGGRVIGVGKTINGYDTEIMLSRDDRRRHLYVTGQTGSGKSTLLEKMILDDIESGEGICLIDPHGDLADNVIAKISGDRARDVVYLNPALDEYPLGINMLEYSSEREKFFVLQEMINMMERLFDDKYTGGSAVTGPMFYHNLRMGLLYVMSGDKPVTLLDLYRFFKVPDYYKQFDTERISDDPLLQAYRNSDIFQYFRKGQDAPLGMYIISKLDNFLGDPMVRNIICQPYSTVDFDSIINEGKIFIVNLSKGLVGDINSRFLGMLIVSKLQLAGMRRADIPMEQRRDFYLYVDEFQNISTKNFSMLLSEARKLRLNLVLANQFMNQLPENITDAILGNVGSSVIFRSGIEDAKIFERLAYPFLSKNDFTKLPNWHAIALLQRDGKVAEPLSLKTIPPQQKADSFMYDLIVEESLSKYGINRRKVENFIRKESQQIVAE